MIGVLFCLPYGKDSKGNTNFHKHDMSYLIHVIIHIEKRQLGQYIVNCVQ